MSDNTMREEPHPEWIGWDKKYECMTLSYDKEKRLNIPKWMLILIILAIIGCVYWLYNKYRISN